MQMRSRAAAGRTELSDLLAGGEFGLQSPPFGEPVVGLPPTPPHRGDPFLGVPGAFRGGDVAEVAGAGADGDAEGPCDLPVGPALATQGDGLFAQFGGEVSRPCAALYERALTFRLWPSTKSDRARPDIQ